MRSPPEAMTLLNWGVLSAASCIYLTKGGSFIQSSNQPGRHHRLFFDPKHPNRLSGHLSANPIHFGALTEARKRPGHETVHSLPFSAKIIHKSRYVCTLLSVFTCCLSKNEPKATVLSVARLAMLSSGT